MRDDKPFSAMLGVLRKPPPDRRREEPDGVAVSPHPTPRPMPPADAVAELEYA